MDLALTSEQRCRVLKAAAIVIPLHEGGFQRDPRDPGNYANGKLIGSKFGISARAFPGEDIPNLTLARAEELYVCIWGHCAWLTNDQVMLKFFDLEINMQWGDRGHATEVLQRAVNATESGFVLAVDRVFGADTATAANACDPLKLLTAMCSEALAYYKTLEVGPEAVFAPGWDKRAAWLPQPVTLV